MKKKITRKVAVALVKTLLAKGDNEGAERIAAKLRATEKNNPSQPVVAKKRKGLSDADVVNYVRVGIVGIEKGLNNLKDKAETLREKVMKGDKNSRKQMENLLLDFRKKVVDQWV